MRGVWIGCGAAVMIAASVTTGAAQTSLGATIDGAIERAAVLPSAYERLPIRFLACTVAGQIGARRTRAIIERNAPLAVLVHPEALDAATCDATAQAEGCQTPHRGRR